MTFIVEGLGQLILNISLFSMGMGLGIIGLILAISRSTTNNNDHRALIFSAFSWAIALIIPNVWYSGFIFAIGAFALSLSFMPIIEKAGDKNIFTLAIVAIIMNALLLIGVGAYGVSYNWQTSLDQSIVDIENIFDIRIEGIGEAIPEYKLCAPNSQEDNNTPCTDDVVEGSFNENLFVPFASLLTIGTYIGKAIAFVGATILAPTILTNVLANQGYFQNTIILTLMGVLISLWEIVIFYKLVAFILDKRGMR